MNISLLIYHKGSSMEKINKLALMTKIDLSAMKSDVPNQNASNVKLNNKIDDENKSNSNVQSKNENFNFSIEDEE